MPGHLPGKQQVLSNTVEAEDFDENETRVLLEGVPFEQFPEELKHKIRGLGLREFLYALPRNLKALLGS